VTTAAVALTNELVFEDLVREHARMVFSIAFHFLHNSSAAEEVSQDVFFELSKKLSALESRDHVTFWLRRVACHRSIDYARHNKRLAAEVALENQPEPSHAPTVKDPMLSRRLKQLIAGLPEKMRMVILLRYQEEAGLEEIASIMGIPVNTVKSTLHRAHAMLRTKMEQTMGEVRA